MSGIKIAGVLLLSLVAASFSGCEDADGSASSVPAAARKKKDAIIVNTIEETAQPVTTAEETQTASAQTTTKESQTTLASDETASTVISETTAPITTTEPETEPATEAPTAPSDDGQLVLIKDYIPDIYLDIRYATTNNFTGTVVYDSPDAYLCYGTVKKLMAVQDALREKGLSLIIWDAYRPVEAQQRLWDVCPNPTYVADPRNGITSHSRGNTVDLGIVASDGSYVPVPSGFDEFSTLADRNYADVPEEAARNSQMLEDIMSANGFYGYWGEWWHYSDYTEYNWHF